MRALRRLAAGLFAAACGAGVVAGVLVAPAATGVAQAADTSQFRPGNIISDQLFFDGNAMSARDVQTFLESKNPTCVPAADGTPCLQDARQDTYTRPADSLCPGTYVGAPNETAATIIAKVGQACGISQRVLLVILQKEQGLVTLSGNRLNATRYEKAMGYGCPDTAPCNPAYAHLFNQLYSAASRYQYYADNPTRFGHRAGQVNQVRFHPTTACGSSAVFIENQATAGLYNYTPYQPNAAALAAGVGTGDGCSAYGNRNFWIYFTDWFGSTQVPGASQVTARYAQTGGEAGPLGAIRAPVVCGLRNAGCLQEYTHGVVYWSQGTGARIVWNGALRDRWASLGWEFGTLGYPVGDGVCGLAGGGCFQPFERGNLYWSQASGAHFLSGPVGDRWGTTGWEYGSLGYPVSDLTATPNGAAQFVHFQRGSVYWSAGTGARILSGPVYDRWAATGWENGQLGLPTSDVTGTPDGQGQYAHFQKGSIYRTAATGARVVGSEVSAKWAATGWETGLLGYPVSDQGTTPDGAARYVHFQQGSVYWSAATGARRLGGPVLTAWAATGWEKGALGLPTSDSATTPDGRAQYAHFQKGSLYTTASGTHLLPTTVAAAWGRTGWERGPLGYPTPASAGSGVVGEALPSGATSHAFEGGVVYASPSTGAHAVAGDLLTAYRAAGGPTGALGLPSSDPGTTPDGVARYQHFTGGSLYSTAAGGTQVVPAAFRDAWSRTGWERGPLGHPTSGATSTAGGTAQVMSFQGGELYVSESTGAHHVPAAFLPAYRAAGGAAGAFGLPVSDPAATPDGIGRYQHFQGGSVYATAATGTRALPTVFREAWSWSGWERGPLGYPTTDVTTTPDQLGRYVHFQGGSVYWTRATGAHVLHGAVRDAWARAGWEQGALGYPTTDLTRTPDGRGQYAHFQRGAVYSSAVGGARVLSGEVLTAWAGTGWEKGSLGFPTSDLQAVPGGARQTFERGEITVSEATGTATVRVG